MTRDETGRRPLLSIVVPALNVAGLIEGALDSMARQTWRDFEVVVADGGSTDGTVERARRCGPRLPVLCVDSRPDRGVYDAMNRGVRLSTGRWFLVLGADDRLHAADTLEHLAPTLAEQVPTNAEASEGLAFVHGDVRMMSDSVTGLRAGQRFAGPVTLERLFNHNLCQQGIVYPRSVFDVLGGFDLQFPLYADWDFNLRAAMAGRMEWIDLVVADYAATGLSADRRDTAFLEGRARRLRQALEAGCDDPRLRPLHRQLVREANRLRRRGRWQEARACLLLYLRLRFGRMPTRPAAPADGSLPPP